MGHRIWRYPPLKWNQKWIHPDHEISGEFNEKISTNSEGYAFVDIVIQSDFKFEYVVPSLDTHVCFGFVNGQWNELKLNPNQPVLIKMAFPRNNQ